MERFMSKALELLANIDKKYNNELQNIEEQLGKGIEQTSRTIKDSLNTRANTTENAIQQSDEMISQRIQNSSQQIEEQLRQYQALIKSKLSDLAQTNEKIQTAERQAQNKNVENQLSLLSMGLISAVAILIILVIALGFMAKSKYSEIQTLNMIIVEKQARVDHLNKSGGSLNISTCTQPNSKAQRLCIQINKKAGDWQDNYMIPMGY
jgi:DNA repair exonuclease SbcCD ATPase subunit